MCDCEGVHLCVLALRETDDLFRISPVTEQDKKKRLYFPPNTYRGCNSPEMAEQVLSFCFFSVFCCISCLI